MKTILELLLSPDSLIKLFLVLFPLIIFINYSIVMRNTRDSSNVIRSRDYEKKLKPIIVYFLSLVATGSILIVLFTTGHLIARKFVTTKEIVVSEHVWDNNDGYVFNNAEELTDLRGEFVVIKRTDNDNLTDVIVYSISTQQLFNNYEDHKIDHIETRVKDIDDYESKVIVKEINYEYFYNNKKLNVDRKNDLHITQIDSYLSYKLDDNN